MKFVYIAGPYGDKGGFDAIEANISRARAAAIEIANMGLGFFCPHLNACHFEEFCPELPVEFWYEMDIRFLGSCDAIYLLPGWQESNGAKSELIEWTNMVDGPIFQDLEKLREWSEEPE